MQTWMQLYFKKALALEFLDLGCTDIVEERSQGFRRMDGMESNLPPMDAQGCVVYLSLDEGADVLKGKSGRNIIGARC